MAMAKHNRKLDPDFESEYGAPDIDYEEAPQASHDEAADADYDEGRQVGYDENMANPDAQEVSQEYYKAQPEIEEPCPPVGPAFAYSFCSLRYGYPSSLDVAAALKSSAPAPAATHTPSITRRCSIDCALLGASLPIRPTT